MNVHHTLICFFFLSLQDGSPIDVYLQTEGGDIGVYCYSPLDGNTTFFCKNECKDKGDLLIETRNDTAQSGRYGMDYETLIANTYLTVSISQLTKSDSGRYRCGLNRSLSSDSYSDFEVIVVDALLARNPPEVKTFYKTTGDNIIVSCFFSVSGSRMYFCREECEDKDILVQTTNVSVQSDRYSVRYVGGFVSGGYLYVKISQLTRADSGLYRCGLNTSFSPDPYQEFRIVITDGVLLYLVVILLIIVIICLLALTIVCIRRKHKPNGTTGGQSDARNLKVAPDFSKGNGNPVFNMEDSTYMNIDAASRDKDQRYATISKKQHP
ncbi:polymeric immunoglobulin receptor-like isoform X2 [Sander lucioperca]|uniref:polymeric immunoglobulin receptor-like isoform X2 n=1 Tax=Sander lucioperca TaxID=283035 RepID=UPI00125E595B|nr:polymeric immunoglobulin receptor-like isoform X2 [Sander lucioperca]